MTYQYREPILQMLEAHGLKPRTTTPPSVLRGRLNDLYRYELRALRRSLLRREFPKAVYASRVETLRDRYRLLSIPLPRWTVGGSPEPAPRRC